MPKRQPVVACGWQNVEAWNQGYDHHYSELTADRCGKPSPFQVVRAEDGNVDLCPDHLTAFLFFYGPHEVAHTDEWSDSLYLRRFRGSRPA